MCRTFSLPEIKRADLFAAAAKASQVLDGTTSQNDAQGGCYEADAWSDEDLFDLLNQFPDEIEMDLDFSSGSSDDSSVDHQSMSDDSLTNSSMTVSCAPSAMQKIALPTYDFGMNYGLHMPEEGFVVLPNPKPFSHLTMKTPANIREEKLNILDPFIGAVNEGDLFSLFSICQTLCAPNVQFNSNSCGFRYGGAMSVMAFWTLLFEEHYQGRLQCLSRRLNSTLRPVPRSVMVSDSSMFESVDFVLKLEGCRLSEFRQFELFQALMNSGCVHEDLSLPEIINVAEAFYKEYQNKMAPSHQIFNMVYLFEITLKFHAIHHTISEWNFELIAVQC